MGKLREFEIAFDNNKDKYSPGESISGTVKIQVAQSLQCKAIKVNCNGFCGVTSKVNDTAWIVEEQYFSSTISVADKGTLKQGEHMFAFRFLIPDTAPTSFEGKYGRIIYRVRAFVDTPKLAKNYSIEKPFYLLRLLNLNEVPDIWGTCSNAVTQQFTYMLMKTGTVVLKAQTDMKGYTPGQVIQVMVNIQNQSGKTTGNMAASLMQKVIYETKKPTYDMRMVAEVEGGVVKAGKEVDWKEQLIVPPLPQSCLTGCELIKIEYYVKVSLKSPDVMLTLPIQIGNVSLDKKRQPKKVTPPPTENKPASTSVPDTTQPDAAPPAASASTPTQPPRPAPKPAPRPAPRSRGSSHSTPSAPPIDYDIGAEGGTPMGADIPNKRQSQLVSPNAFSYAPGLFFPGNQQHNTPSTAPSAPVSTGGTSLYPSLNGANNMPTPHIFPPDYGTSSYPHAIQFPPGAAVDY
ncbi:arrestin domain-containing protein 1a isoform X2 [Mugil cephalus]|uniref:arrestin domain-containing protein 1a isoform X2 n=1 Tax=Mugil cephalus TaxID=48193 RepID=UPI001FB79CFB|nr:arrestin domain-containing protein 1a isoform X2 [Mugil cephalus]XP_047448782.1 arrestin domain-containing protein 1a isoform X2 [Mugil cephalus]